MGAYGKFRQCFLQPLFLGRAGEGGACGNLGQLEKVVDYHKKNLVIAEVVGDRGGVARAKERLVVVE